MENNFCPECGTRLAPSAAFCNQCGRPIVQDILIADQVSLTRMMKAIAQKSPQFRSESEFRIALSQELQREHTDLVVDSNVPFNLLVDTEEFGKEEVDLVCASDATNFRTFIELKFKTKESKAFPENRHAFVSDIRRLETLCRDNQTNGIAILLTDADTYWENQSAGLTVDHAFRLHEGAKLSGTLDYQSDRKDSIHLDGEYIVHWSDFLIPQSEDIRKWRWAAVNVAFPAPTTFLGGEARCFA